MSEALENPAEAAAAPDATLDAAIAALRAEGADRLDRVGFRLIEILARRALTQPAPTRRLLEARAARALDAYREKFRHPGTPQHHDDNIVRGAAPSPLAALLEQLNPAAGGDQSGSSGQDSGTPEDLKSVRAFHEGWATLSARQTVGEALAAAPANAGPLNSPALVLQALRQMRDQAPDYLRHFMAYADALVWLDQANAAGVAAKAPGRRREATARRSRK